MKKATIDQKMTSAKCRELVKSYFGVFDVIATELVEETSGTINEKTSDGIALEYMKREGMKMGIKEFLRRIHHKAATSNE